MQATLSAELTIEAPRTGWDVCRPLFDGDVYELSSINHCGHLFVSEQEGSFLLQADDLAQSPQLVSPQQLAEVLTREAEQAKRPYVSTPEATERIASAKMRIGQDLYRAKLLEMWGGRCAITGVSCPDLLRASHAKPWKDANDHERLDPYNGFLLEARFDALFDQGYISFNDEGSIIISPQLSHEDQLALGLIPTPLALKKHHPKHLPYLRWHREHVFRR